MIVCHVRPQYSLRMLFLLMTLGALIAPAIASHYNFEKAEAEVRRLTEELRRDIEEAHSRCPGGRSNTDDRAFKAVIMASEAEHAQLQNTASREASEQPPVADAHGSP